MQQNIYSILLFSLCSILVYYICPKKYRDKVLFIESLLFYAICDWKFVLLILVETFVSWEFAKRMNKMRFVFGIVFVLIFLGFFKYCNFFIDVFNLSLANILLPLGISYYSFKIISYLIDVYLKKREAEEIFINYSIYVLFFPHLICGPIVRSESLTKQIKKRLVFDTEKFSNGLVHIITGLFMKSVIADRCSGYVNLIFSNPDNYPSLALILSFVYILFNYIAILLDIP